MNIETCEALTIDERGEISWTQLIELSGLTDAELRELVDDGALAPVGQEGTAWRFQARSVVVARTAGRLRRELDLDAHALAVVMRFLARIDELQAELRALRAGVATRR
ncbi:MAG TPA: chaperone modulator CbpM [Casimicrobiaceae bacterium]|jgi:chaperone modulatory protein CbpM|nr:chaperone modulator CbpM [Casimicrobiaceae bacterium]